MKVLMLGVYNLETQPKSQTIRDGLRLHGAKVKVVTDQSKSKYFKIIKALLKNDYDVIFATGHFVLILSKIFSRKPVLYDIFISAHDTLVLDRRIYREKSLIAKIIFFLDKFTCRIANMVTIDTKEYVKYFIKNYHLNPKKVKVIYLGSYDKKFFPRKRKKSKHFIVHYHGGFIPLHGTEFIVRTAKLLEEYSKIKFIMIGKGQDYFKVKNLSKKLDLKNIRFLGWVSDEVLFQNIANADVCLGMFGTTQKNPRTISNKVFEYMAMKKAFITGESPANREILVSGENCVLCARGNPKAIAESILMLKNSSKLRSKLARNAHKQYQDKFSISHIGKATKDVLQQMIVT